MHQFRLTKYDPALRDAAGAFLADEWNARSDIGRIYAGTVLTQQEYERVESAYALGASALLEECGVAALRVSGVEGTSPLENGELVPLASLAPYFRQVLREEYWCRFEAVDAFVHFGHDFYMYLGLPSEPAETCTALAESGLFLEPFASPYTGDPL